MLINDDDLGATSKGVCLSLCHPCLYFAGGSFLGRPTIKAVPCYRSQELKVVVLILR